ncbi:5-(carboxyamino)imidazole ribonucleotide synthase [Salinibacillus xinjiangensis]|uniref:N5-carboxyaminoimidazole ribonucleotide synthase n=1 Tax=Salinibacillus xinjiangensis TaxID=1229268 RepID=A0A6G1XAZ4_9BACI|nr:5-(carboxyamino)imidazole ribonucleotide synthase [Salinibacillus xinjiangensis]MRG88050.1 5-(carboxyamino)imidazole ribonucleotide synthase [Salinibacillus xinjiangensis]
MDIILPGSTIGIIGGGQLGRMMAVAAKEMGYQVAVLDPTPNSPTGQLADVEIVAPYDDLEAAKQLADVSDVVTYEFENVDYDVLTWLEDNANLPQGSELIQVTQDRANEKIAIEKSGAAFVPYHLVNSYDELKQAIDRIGIPSVLKTRTGGYDGKGQVMVKSQSDIQEAAKLLEQGPCILEKFIDFDKEISVIVNRNGKGETKTFPVGENIHHEHILLQTIVPARVELSINERAQHIAIDLAESLDMVGTLGVEMFLTKEGHIYLNELAPRPHNSGHYTLNACETTQFQQHVRAICQWPLGSTELQTPVVMMNILGEHVDKVVANIPNFRSGHLHLYGKNGVKPKRKVGHINVTGSELVTILDHITSLNVWHMQDEASGVK